ncbi:uncharacterized protein LOC118756910 [Rhagoletis pomonella]|uniref:uncharacterized protein LOC118756910 n=1 Tax=Rhagoletis pomonella TaxID=28610 RepID=UPI00178180AE|nr:uncharacterized protein LOC118756910 [Rhagoletis pomonella]
MSPNRINNGAPQDMAQGQTPITETPGSQQQGTSVLLGQQQHGAPLPPVPQHRLLVQQQQQQSANLPLGQQQSLVQQQQQSAHLQQPPIQNEFHARIPMPRITPNDMDAWFTSVDYWFRACNMRSDAQRYYHVMATLDPLTLPTIGQICRNAENPQRVLSTGVGMYEYLKRELLKYFGESQQRRIQRLLEEMVLGNQRPSQLYNAMLRVAGNSFSEDALRAMWIQRLPELVRASIIAREGPIDVQIAVADAVMETVSQRQVCAISETSASTAPSTEVATTLAKITSAIHQLQKRFDDLNTRGRSHRRNPQRTRSRSRRSSSQRSEPPNSQECWYHQTFGDAATRCRSPCGRRQRGGAEHESSRRD